MIKRTLLLTSPAHLSTRYEQLVVKLRDAEEETRVPMEDIGVLLLESPEVTISTAALSKLTHYNVAVVVCDAQHLPSGLLLPLDANSVQTERFLAQLEAKLPLKKQLWQQTVAAKLLNQALHLEHRGKPAETLRRLSKQVQSGDKGNREAHGAKLYWKALFEGEDFSRDRFGAPPNNLLNYGYAALRAAVARALVSSGLLPTVGIHHQNRYNAFCLADDVMEPYRPFVDCVALDLWQKRDKTAPLLELNKDHKRELLQVLTAPTDMQGERSPLLVALSQTTASLARCFQGEARQILYPKFLPPKRDEPNEPRGESDKEEEAE
ncbi:MAG: type II CRISPR-associated endonuclease Cas1 [Chloroherpetonaceae bacterium]|nr:type II CRISPR-associated endonuclease Cas1 [Chloroherpetonaceae bacterium]MDW8436702.1 type II CRISPR-associated endonuclease Cas1 [Chloroherpetonaceae bacterium]